MNAIAIRLVVWLIVLTVPVHALAAAMTALQGPAHHHAIDRTPAAAPTRDNDSQHAQHALHDHPHDHDSVRHHYRLPDEGAVIVDDDTHHDAAAAQSRSAKSDSAGAGFAALVSRPTQLHPPRLAHALDIAGAARVPDRPLPRIERPPRSS